MVAGTAERIAVTVTWPQIRALIRVQLLAGDVSFRSAYHETVRARITHGLDTVSRCLLWDALKAIRELEPVKRNLIRRDIGYHCIEAKCRTRRGSNQYQVQWDRGHWHTEGFGHLKWTHSVKELKRLAQEARDFVEQACS